MDDHADEFADAALKKWVIGEKSGSIPRDCTSHVHGNGA
jgi:hypothetical protein